MAAGALVDRAMYERQIERLHQRSLLTNRLYTLRQDDVALASIVINRGKVAKLMARDMRRGRYRLQPGELRTIRVKQKERQVFSCRLTDLIVHGVVAAHVRDHVEPLVSDRVFSYRAGLSPLTPIGQLAAYVRRHRRAHPNPRDRGLYVLRRDVDSYTDAIPIGDRSPLWPMIAEGLGGDIPDLVRQCIRTELRVEGGGVVCRTHGLPMGQPIAAVIANLYLRDVDRVLQSVPGGFYARYGDDFIFAHPDPSVTRAADAAADRELERLSLTVNERKRRTTFLTPAGRPSEAWDGVRGAPYVPFLGTRITAVGTVGLGGSKVTGLLREIHGRVGATVRTLSDVDLDARGRTVCAVVNSALDPADAVSQHGHAVLLRRVVTDRQQLAQIDATIARIIAEGLTGRRGARALRQIPPRRLRREWGLRSLVAARNRVGRPRSAQQRRRR